MFQMLIEHQWWKYIETFVSHSNLELRMVVNYRLLPYNANLKVLVSDDFYTELLFPNYLRPYVPVGRVYLQLK